MRCFPRSLARTARTSCRRAMTRRCECGARRRGSACRHWRGTAMRCVPRSLARTARISCRRALTQRIGYGVFAIESSSLRCSYACHLAINTNQKCTITSFVLVCNESLEWHNPFCANQSWFDHVRSCMLCFLDPLLSRGTLMRNCIQPCICAEAHIPHEKRQIRLLFRI